MIGGGSQRSAVLSLKILESDSIPRNMILELRPFMTVEYMKLNDMIRQLYEVINFQVCCLE